MNKAFESRDYKRKALALFRRHNFAEGEVKMSRGFKLTSSSTRQEYLKSYCDQLISWGQQLEEKEQSEKAQNKFKRVNSIIPGQPTVLFNLGNSLYKQGKAENAIIMYNKALSDRSLSPKIYNNWGYILYQQGKYGEAIRMYEKAVEWDPEYLLAYFNMVLALYYLNNQEEAEKVCDKVLRVIEEREYDVFDVVEVIGKEILRSEEEMMKISGMTFYQYKELKLKFEGFKYIFDLLGRKLKSKKRVDEKGKICKDEIPVLITMTNSI